LEKRRDLDLCGRTLVAEWFVVEVLARRQRMRSLVVVFEMGLAAAVGLVQWELRRVVRLEGRSRIEMTDKICRRQNL
jgi:uncharacterized membrane protein YjdF